MFSGTFHKTMGTYVNVLKENHLLDSIGLKFRFEQFGYRLVAIEAIVQCEYTRHMLTLV